MGGVTQFYMDDVIGQSSITKEQSDKLLGWYRDYIAPNFDITTWISPDGLVTITKMKERKHGRD